MRFGLFYISHCQTQLNKCFVDKACFDLGEGRLYIVVVIVEPFCSKPVLSIVSFFHICFEISHVSEWKVNCDGATEARVVEASALVSVRANHDSVEILVGGVICQHQQPFF